MTRQMISRAGLLFTFYFLIFTLAGCEAFVRKFTRKPKKEDIPEGQMVLAPEEYKAPQMTKEERYRQYFLFWQSWHDELISGLLNASSHKRQVSCADEAIKNMEQLRLLLSGEKQEKFDIYLKRMKDLRRLIADDIYNTNAVINRSSVERLKRDILRDFSYQDIKNYLI